MPVGTSAQRPGEVGVPIAVAQGQIRYNTGDQTFEGYDGNNWGGLGGVKDVDQNTYIIPETSPGADNNQLDFFTEAVHRLRIDVNGDILIGENLDKFTIDYLTGDTITLGRSYCSTEHNYQWQFNCKWYNYNCGHRNYIIGR